MTDELVAAKIKTMITVLEKMLKVFQHIRTRDEDIGDYYAQDYTLQKLIDELEEEMPKPPERI